ncbi:unnamed protein product [Meloidogyne enterolobii]
MLGNLFNIPYQILGLTAVAWCNSIGDLIADVSVARQGMPRMALSAAIGGPLFSLLNFLLYTRDGILYAL